MTLLQSVFGLVNAGLGMWAIFELISLIGVSFKGGSGEGAGGDSPKNPEPNHIKLKRFEPESITEGQTNEITLVADNLYYGIQSDMKFKVAATGSPSQIQIVEVKNITNKNAILVIHAPEGSKGTYKLVVEKEFQIGEGENTHSDRVIINRDSQIILNVLPKEEKIMSATITEIHENTFQKPTRGTKTESITIKGTNLMEGILIKISPQIRVEIDSYNQNKTEIGGTITIDSNAEPKKYDVYLQAGNTKLNSELKNGIEITGTSSGDVKITNVTYKYNGRYESDNKDQHNSHFLINFCINGSGFDKLDLNNTQITVDGICGIGKIRIESDKKIIITAILINPLITLDNNLDLKIELENGESINHTFTLEDNRTSNEIELDPSKYWIFGYGSLPWDSSDLGTYEREFKIGKLEGHHREYNQLSTVSRGCKEQPGVVLGTKEGGDCVGIVFPLNTKDDFDNFVIREGVKSRNYLLKNNIEDNLNIYIQDQNSVKKVKSKVYVVLSNDKSENYIGELPLSERAMKAIESSKYIEENPDKKPRNFRGTSVDYIKGNYDYYITKEKIMDRALIEMFEEIQKNMGSGDGRNKSEDPNPKEGERDPVVRDIEDESLALYGHE